MNQTASPAAKDEEINITVGIRCFPIPRKGILNSPVFPYFSNSCGGADIPGDTNKRFQDSVLGNAGHPLLSKVS